MPSTTLDWYRTRCRDASYGYRRPRDDEGDEGVVPSLVFGDLRLERVPTVFLPRPASDPTRALGNLGNGFLQHTVLTLDYRRRRLNVRAVRTR